GDVGVWAPHLAEVLDRHGLGGGPDPVAGDNPTYPTFLVGDVVVKLFGGTTSWPAAYAAELAVQTVLRVDPRIAAPRFLADGWLHEGAWPYLVTTVMPGTPVWRAALTADELRAVVTDIGSQVRRIHRLPHDGVPTDASWSGDLTTALEASRLPGHLAAQAEDYVARLEPTDPVVVHADINDNHVFVAGGRLSGIIDWGDAVVADRHIEIIQIHRSLLDCDRNLLRVFLAASDWPIGDDFPRRALGQALRRQALMWAQHQAGDVFEPIAAKFPLPDIGTLDELAQLLFAV
ncbi:MAG: phosphotransferase, partial [Geodermatophilaceae bacterium]|nr:phosphotransferase [Geodermatophilaceae bacterium]